VLAPGDVTELFKQLKSFAHHGGAVVLITHKLSDAREHADDVTVLRRGRLVLNEEMSATTDESLAAAMLGSSRDFSTPQRKSIPSVSTTVVSVRSVVLADNPRRSPVSLEIGRGEIVGIAALDGAATSLLRAIANRVKPLSGTIELPERIGFVPENRKDEALIADFSLAENLALADASSRSGVMDWNAIADETTEVIRAFDVRTPGNEVSAAKLSGGNQQRFVLGRELRGRPALLVLENPTQGLDLNAAHFVHEQLGEALGLLVAAGVLGLLEHHVRDEPAGGTEAQPQVTGGKAGGLLQRVEQQAGVGGDAGLLEEQVEATRAAGGATGLGRPVELVRRAHETTSGVGTGTMNRPPASA